MYKKVLMAVDASPQSMKTAEHVVEMVKNGIIGKITLVNVVPEAKEEKPRWPGEFGAEVAPMRPVNLETRFAVESRLAPVLDIFEAAGVAAELQILLGKPSEVICSLATEGNYDLVITGSRGLNHLEGVLMESTSARILSSAGCPVMVFNPIPKTVPVVPANQLYEF